MISADEVRSMLRVDKSRLDDEIERHSQVAEEITRKVALLEREAAEAADSLKRIEAGLLLDFREKEKLTVAEADARIVRDNSRREALRVQLSIAEQLAVWKGLQAAWRNKSHDMRTLADLYTSNYFDAASSFYSRRDREEERSTAREAMHRSRRSLD